MTLYSIVVRSLSVTDRNNIYYTGRER